MANGTVRGLLVLFSASALIGASWSPLRAPHMPGLTSSGHSETDRSGSPVVYVSLAAVDRGFVPLPQAFTNAALGSDETAPAEPSTKPLPFLRKLRFGKHKDYERLVFDFSDRLDFWYWTMPQQDTLTLEFPLLQPYENKSVLSNRSKLITGTRFAGNAGKNGGKFAIGLADNSRLKRIFLLPPGKSGGHRLVVDISKIEPERPPSLGTGMAWGGGDAIDNIGTTLLARLYGSGSTALAVKDKQKQPKAGATSKLPIPARPLVRTNAVITKSTFDPLWPQPVDAKTKALQAQALAQSLKGLVASHERIKAARLDVAAARETLAGLKKGNTPTLDITAFYGYERQNKPTGSVDTNMPPREIDFKLTQLVSDFGAMTADVEKAELAVARADAILQATVQAVVLEGLAAHYQLAGAHQSLRYARLSEQNIKRQTALEDARVQRGSGLATDVLQAKAQLAGAGARRVQAEGAQAAARYRYLAVFGALPEDTNVFLTLPVPDEKMPETLESGIDVALAKNPLLEVGRLASEIARAETRRLKSAGFYPELNLIAEAKWKKDVGGTVGSQQEQIIRLEMTFPFNLAGAAVDTVNASKQAYLASSQRLAESRTLIRETVQSAWQQFRTAKLSARQLRNQADLAAEFLGLARKERKLGKRSLIEVLSGEAALANARSDAVAAENDLAVSAWTLLATMGTLDPESVI